MKKTLVAFFGLICLFCNCFSVVITNNKLPICYAENYLTKQEAEAVDSKIWENSLYVIHAYNKMSDYAYFVASGQATAAQCYSYMKKVREYSRSRMDVLFSYDQDSYDSSTRLYAQWYSRLCYDIYETANVGMQAINSLAPSDIAAMTEKQQALKSTLGCLLKAREKFWNEHNFSKAEQDVLWEKGLREIGE